MSRSRPVHLLAEHRPSRDAARIGAATIARRPGHRRGLAVAAAVLVVCAIAVGTVAGIVTSDAVDTDARGPVSAASPIPTGSLTLRTPLAPPPSRWPSEGMSISSGS